MPRVFLDLNNVEDLRKVKGQWRVAQGLIPGQPNEGLTAQLLGSPARLPDYDDTGWELCTNIRKSRSVGFTFAWYRLTLELPEQVNGIAIAGTRVFFETNVDNYGEVWVDGKQDRVTGMIQGNNAQQRVEASTNAVPGTRHVIACLAANGPLGEPRGGVFLRYATLAFESRDRPYRTEARNMIKKETSAKRSTVCSLLAFFALLSFVAVSAFGAQATRDLKEIKIAYPPSLSSTILMTAIKQKMFEREGFRPTLLIINSNLGLTSQTVGEIDYTLFGAASGMVAVAQGMPIKIVHFGFKFADYTLVARPEFKTVGQLRGKKIAVSGFSGSIYSSTRAILSSGGLDPDKDVTVLQVGREDMRIQALFSGTIDATVLPAPLQALAEEKGYSLITDIEGKFEVPLSGLTVTDKKLKENPEEVKRVIRALVDGGRFYMTNRAESVALYTDWLKLPKPIAERAYTRSLRFVSPDGLGKESTIKNQLDIVKKITKKDIKQEDVIDFTLLKSILAENR